MPFFQQAQNFQVYGGHFEDHSQVHNHYHGLNGLHILHNASLPAAAFNSAARQSAASCLPGTREQYINDITSWFRAHNLKHRRFLPEKSAENGSSRPLRRLLWFNGPLGVGKSAIAQTCAEILQETRTELGAAFFFSRPNRLDNPTRFFPSVAYQLATRLQPAKSPYGLLLEEILRNDPSILTKSLRLQCQKLLVEPIMFLLGHSDDAGRADHHHHALIIIDGLDEANGSHAQREILETISKLTYDNPTFPLLWAVFSRPEQHIASTIQEFHDLWWEISLPLSSDAHDDIELYLQSNFQRIQEQYNLPCSPHRRAWPSSEEITALVRKSAGLFVYAANIVRFFDDPQLLEREKRLSELLSSAPHLSTQDIVPLSPYDKSDGVTVTTQPLADLDSFYIAIMERIPPQNWSFTMNLLFVLSGELVCSGLTLMNVCNVLGYSISTSLSALYPLHAVLSLRCLKDTSGTSVGKEEGSDVFVGFYHYSFVEFLRSLGRSGAYCVQQSGCQVSWTKRCVRILSEFSQGGFSRISLSESPKDLSQKEELQKNLLIEASYSVLSSCAHIPDLSNEVELIRTLQTVDFRQVVVGVGQAKRHLVLSLAEDELQKLVTQFRHYTQAQPWLYRSPPLIRERLRIPNSLTRRFVHYFGPTPSARVVPVYELGYSEKMVYLYPEKPTGGSVEVEYHVFLSADELCDPYIFADEWEHEEGRARN